MSPTLQDENALPLGLISYFESRDRVDGALRILHEALDWLRDVGVRTVVGPMDGDVWHRYDVATLQEEVARDPARFHELIRQRIYRETETHILEEERKGTDRVFADTE